MAADRYQGSIARRQVDRRVANRRSGDRRISQLVDRSKSRRGHVRQRDALLLQIQLTVSIRSWCGVDLAHHQLQRRVFAGRHFAACQFDIECSSCVPVIGDRVGSVGNRRASNGRPGYRRVLNRCPGDRRAGYRRTRNCWIRHVVTGDRRAGDRRPRDGWARDRWTGNCRTCNRGIVKFNICNVGVWIGTAIGIHEISGNRAIGVQNEERGEPPRNKRSAETCNLVDVHHDSRCRTAGNCKHRARNSGVRSDRHIDRRQWKRHPIHTSRQRGWDRGGRHQLRE